MIDPEAETAGTERDDQDGDESLAPAARALIRKVRSQAPGSYKPPSPSEYSVADTARPGIAGTDTWPAARPGDEPVSGVEAGTSIGKFEIRRMLGQGGFGLVLLAYDSQLDRNVALKIPRLESLMTTDGRSRFLREARAAALLGHPNIVPVFEAGQVGPTLFIAFEFVDGLPLNEWLKSRKKPVDSVSITRLMIALASAVQHAHSRGIVHRDLKPGNVLVPMESGSEPADGELLARSARISDFGMARISTEDGLTTRTGAVVGTPAYMSPEQVQRGENPVGPATDVYGLGAILYELLTGRPPFEGSSIASVIRAVEQDDPVPPRRINPGVSRDLEAICLKCLAKKPSWRYPTANELESDLQRSLDGEVIQALHATIAERTARWIARNRAVSLAASIAFLSLFTGLAVALSQARRAENNFAEARSQQARAERSQNRTQSTIDQLLNEVVDVLEPIPNMSRFRTALLEQALVYENEMAQEESDDPHSQLRAVRSKGRVGEIEFKLGRFDDALESFQQAQAMLVKIVPLSDPDKSLHNLLRLTSIRWIAQTWMSQNRYAEAETLLVALQVETGPEQLAEADVKTVRIVATIQGLLGRALYRQGKYGLAESEYQKALSVYERIPENERLPEDLADIPLCHAAIANICMSTGDLRKGAGILENVLVDLEKLRASATGPSLLGARIASIHVNLATAYFELKDFGPALEHYRTAVEVTEEMVDGFPEIIGNWEIHMSSLTGLGAALNRLKKTVDAEVAIRKSIEVGKSVEAQFGIVPGVMDSQTRSQGNLGNLLYYQLNDADQARASYDDQIATCKRLTEKYPHIAAYQYSTAFAYNNMIMLDTAGEDWKAVKAGLEPGIRAIDNALAGDAQNRKYQMMAADLKAKWIGVCCRLGEHDAAISAADEVANNPVIPVDDLLTVAGGLACCFPSIHLENDADQKARLVTAYRTQLFSILNAAIEHGLSDATTVSHLGQLAGLDSDETFQEILDRIR